MLTLLVYSPHCMCLNSPHSHLYILLTSETAIVAKSNIVLDVKPWDDETDMKELENCVRSVSCEGLLWGACEYLTCILWVAMVTDLLPCVLFDIYRVYLVYSPHCKYSFRYPTITVMYCHFGQLRFKVELCAFINILRS